MSLKDRFLSLYNCSLTKEGSVAEHYSSNGWQINSRRDFNDWEMEEVRQFFSINGHSYDRGK